MQTPTLSFGGSSLVCSRTLPTSLAVVRRKSKNDFLNFGCFVPSVLTYRILCKDLNNIEGEGMWYDFNFKTQSGYGT
jgi:hypothetical protein